MTVNPLSGGDDMPNLAAIIANELATLAADAQTLATRLSIGDVVAAVVLPSNGLTDLLDIGGLRVAAELPPTVLPGETITVSVAGFSGDRINLQIVGEGAGPAAAAASTKGIPDTLVHSAAAPTPPRSTPVNGIPLLVPRNVRPVTERGAAIEARIATARATTPPVQPVAAPASRLSPLPRSPVAPAKPPPAVARPFIEQRSATAPPAPASTASRGPAAFAEPAALLRALHLPVTASNVAAARIALDSPERLPHALETLERALSSATGPHVATLRTLVGFLTRLEPRSPVLATQVAAFVDQIVIGREGKLARLLSAQAQASNGREPGDSGAGRPAQRVLVTTGPPAAAAALATRVVSTAQSSGLETSASRATIVPRPDASSLTSKAPNSPVLNAQQTSVARPISQAPNTDASPAQRLPQVGATTEDPATPEARSPASRFVGLPSEQVPVEPAGAQDSSERKVPAPAAASDVSSQRSAAQESSRPDPPVNESALQKPAAHGADHNAAAQTVLHGSSLRASFLQGPSAPPSSLPNRGPQTAAAQESPPLESALMRPGSTAAHAAPGAASDLPQLSSELDIPELDPPRPDAQTTNPQAARVPGLGVPSIDSPGPSGLASLAAERVAVREAALDYDLKTQLLAAVTDTDSPAGNRPAVKNAALTAAVSGVLSAVTSLQLAAAASLAANPDGLAFALPIALPTGFAQARVRVDRNMPQARNVALDGDNFHIAFVLETQHLGMVAIDLVTVGRSVTLSVSTEAVVGQRAFGSALSQLTQRLETLRYRVAKADAVVAPPARLLPKTEPAVAAPSSGGQQLVDLDA